MKMEDFWAGLFVLIKPCLFIQSVKEELIEKEEYTLRVYKGISVNTNIYCI